MELSHFPHEAPETWQKTEQEERTKEAEVGRSEVEHHLQNGGIVAVLLILQPL